MSRREHFGPAVYLATGAVLLSAVPVLEIAQRNVDFLDWQDVLVTLAVLAGIPGLVILALALLFPRRLYLAAGAAVLNWMCLNSDGLADRLNGMGVADPGMGALLGVLALFPLLLVLLSRLPQRLVAGVIGTAGSAIFGLSAVQLALQIDYGNLAGSLVGPAAALERAPLAEPDDVQRPLPDILYLVPDRYGSAGVLARAFDYDNTPFLASLEERGFAVARKARANYLSTQYSLASSMNMQYIEPLLDALHGETRRVQPLYALIDDNLVVERLKRLGYRYVHLGSWWDGTRDSSEADEVVDFGLPVFGGEFGMAMVDSSPILTVILKALYPLDECTALKRQLSYLERAGGDDRPVFIFAHVLAPHSPILTDAAGNCIREVDYPKQPPGVTWPEFQSAYAGYVRYLNGRFLEIFDRQRAENPNPLIMVLQADEGPYPKAFREALGNRDPSFDWRRAGRADLVTKYGILNALYLGEPGSGSATPEVPDDLTPVNNWRIIFGRLEGTAYPLLANRHFIIPMFTQPYTSIEITRRLTSIR